LYLEETFGCGWETFYERDFMIGPFICQSGCDFDVISLSLYTLAENGNNASFCSAQQPIKLRKSGVKLGDFAVISLSLYTLAENGNKASLSNTLPRTKFLIC